MTGACVFLYCLIVFCYFVILIRIRYSYSSFIVSWQAGPLCKYFLLLLVIYFRFRFMHV